MKGIRSFSQLAGHLMDEVEHGRLRPGFMEEIRRGSASGFVMVLPADAPGSPADLVLLVRLEIMAAPDDAGRRTALAKRLLELNHGLLGRASFSIGPEGAVFLTAGRPIEDLDPGEILDLLLWTSEQADLYDDGLIAEYGRTGDAG